jgi:hypothetical protein
VPVTGIRALCLRIPPIMKAQEHLADKVDRP